MDCYAEHCGPWLEDLWVQLRSLPYENFGEFIPLFVPWVAQWREFGRGDGRTQYVSFIKKIFHLMNEKYLYVTVSTDDDGLKGGDGWSDVPKNLLILSAGGQGHIPLPLMAKPREIYTDVSEEYDLVFAGNGGSHAIRFTAAAIMTRDLSRRSRFLGREHNWVQVFSKSKAVLCPRGYGRNSYRLSEVIQLGFIPVQLYSDIRWVPYYDSINWSSFGFSCHISEFGEIFEQIKKLTKEDVERMRKRAREVGVTHFSFNGTITQILKFLKGGFRESDLRCAKFSLVRNLINI